MAFYEHFVFCFHRYVAEVETHLDAGSNQPLLEVLIHVPDPSPSVGNVINFRICVGSKHWFASAYRWRDQRFFSRTILLVKLPSNCETNRKKRFVNRLYSGASRCNFRARKRQEITQGLVDQGSAPEVLIAKRARALSKNWVWFT